MKLNSLLTLIALCLVGPGCRLVQNTWLTTVAEPLHYPRNLDDHLSRKRFRAMAESALDQAESLRRAELDKYDCNPFPPDYELGFIDGFVDYLHAGGTGTPPALPPRRYWKTKYQNAFGYECMQEWFRGYEHGAAVAHESNYRVFVTVPVSDAVAWQTEQSTYGRISTAEATDENQEQRDDGTRFALLPGKTTIFSALPLRPKPRPEAQEPRRNQSDAAPAEPQVE